MWNANDSCSPRVAIGETSATATSTTPRPKTKGRQRATGVPRRASVRARLA